MESADAYSIHHSDSPSTVLVTPLLTGDNYGSWSRAIAMALRAKSKFGFVDGSIAKPEEIEAANKWGRCNDLVTSWILNSVSPEIRPSILYSETVAQIWVGLKDRFSQSNAPKIYQLKQSICALKQEGMTISLYYTQLKSLWDELNAIMSITPCICGNGKNIIEQQNQDRAMEFLQGLHDRFSAIRSQILLMDPFPTIQRIYNLVRQEEKQQEINFCTPVMESAALQAFKSSSHPPAKRQRPFCDHCQKHGHTIATCFKLNGYPNKDNKQATKPASSSMAPAPVRQFTPEQYNRVLALLAKDEADGLSANFAGPSNEEEDWSG